MARPRYRVPLVDGERAVQEQLVRTSSTPHAITRRARILLLANGEGWSNQAIAEALRIQEADLPRRNKRWIERAEKLSIARLRDCARMEVLARISAEQWRPDCCRGPRAACAACPPDHALERRGADCRGLRAGHRRGAIGRPSAQSTEKERSRPHRCRYWLNGKSDPGKNVLVNTICALYRKHAHNPGEIVFSIDEMTDIQALERIAADLPMSARKPLGREFQNRRQGTQRLIGAMRVDTGEVCTQCGATSTAADFARFVDTLGRVYAGFDVYRFVVDQLNTYKSETLRRTATTLRGRDADLGVEGRIGHAALNADACQLSRATQPAHCLPLHAAALLLHEPNRNLVLHPRTRRRLSRKFLLRRGTVQRIARLHRLLQRNHDQAFKWTYRGAPVEA